MKKKKKKKKKKIQKGPPFSRLLSRLCNKGQKRPPREKTIAEKTKTRVFEDVDSLEEEISYNTSVSVPL